MDELLSSLRATIGDFRTLRMQRDAIQKRRYRPAEIKSSFGVEIMADQLPAVMEMQKASKRVYAAIASVAHCSCHRFYFRLQCETPEKSEKQSFGDSSDFRLVLTNGSGESMISCICIAVRKEGASTPEAYPPPPSYSTFPKQEAATAVAINKKQKQLRFTDNSPSPTTSSLNTILTDLCSTVRSLHSAPSYLGALPITDPHRHIFTESVKPSICRISLPRVFERAPLSRTRSILPPKRRYRLAWVLSASLLRFGFSTNWFRENWRSGDIYFLQDEDPSTLDSPHISVRFSSSSSSPISSGTCLAKNEQLYSLAIALIEIGYGDTLQNLITEGDKGSEEWNHAREYAGAKELMENIGQVMSRRYAMVVRRCFYCSFAIDEGDLTPQKLQRAYYEKVECELRGCMNEFG
ncbi:hypothetical protein BDD12DRAFT_253463 [Trichophaea hybrida]|nr:hypothetical protein BDD12DRAFT_253463 [Trichophaea hybrida]